MSSPDAPGRPAAGWLVIRRPAPAARLRLFCFPYGGGGASVFHPWAAALPAEVEVCAVQLPGRETRLSERPEGDVMALVDRLYDALAPAMDRRFAFFGHSSGALMAFELARRLRREGRPGPAHLFVSGRPAPHLPLPEPHVYALPEPEFLEVLRRYGGTPEEILQHEELMRLMLPALRADFALGETYRYRHEPPLAVPLSAYGGAADAEVPEEQVQAWSEHTTGAFRASMFPGGHFFVNAARGRVLEELGGELRGVLDAAPAHA